MNIDEIKNCVVPESKYAYAMFLLIEQIKMYPLPGKIRDSLCTSFTALWNLADPKLGEKLIEQSDKEAADLTEIEHAAWVGGRKDAIRDVLAVVDCFIEFKTPLHEINGEMRSASGYDISILNKIRDHIAALEEK